MLRVLWPDCLWVRLARSSHASASLSRCALSAGEPARRASSTDRMAFSLYPYSFLVTGHLVRQPPNARYVQNTILSNGFRELEKKPPSVKRRLRDISRGQSGTARKGGVATAGRADPGPLWHRARRGRTSIACFTPRSILLWRPGLVCLVGHYSSGPRKAIGASKKTLYCCERGFDLSASLTYWIELLPMRSRGRIRTRTKRVG
jgi:hypothetical protein